MDGQKPSPEKGVKDEQAAATPPRIDPAACATLMRHIGKKYVVKEPVVAVQMAEAFTLNGRAFDAGASIIEMTDESGASHYVGLGESGFNTIYRPARKPRKA